MVSDINDEAVLAPIPLSPGQLSRARLAASCWALDPDRLDVPEPTEEERQRLREALALFGLMDPETSHATAP